MPGTRKREVRPARPTSSEPGDTFDAVLLDLMEEGVVVHGPDGAAAYWNSAAERILGVSAARMAGSLTLVPGHELTEEDGQPLRLGDEPAHLALSTGRPCLARTVRIRRPGGASTWLGLSAAAWPTRDGDGPAGAVTVICDLTERKAAEQRARGAHRMEALGRLAGGVAHDFNNLLTVILSYNDLLLRGLGATDPRRKEAEQVRLAAQRAAGLTRQLLAFSRQQQLELRVLDLNRVVADIRPILGRLIGEDIHLQVDASPRLGPVRADRTQIEQVLLNLAVNARDAMPGGGQLRIVTADLVLDQTFENEHPGSHAGPHVMLSVSDDGCGMDGSTQAHIFEPFFTTKPQDKGTGLGLSIVYGIVKQSGGYITVESAPAQGSTFRIYLPCCEDAAEKRPGTDTSAVARVGGAVLLVEGDVQVRELARHILEEQGYVVLEEPDGERVLARLEHHPDPIGVLVTDLAMPGLRGPELVRRAAELRPGIRVLFLSGQSDATLAESGGPGGGAHFLPKPFAADALVLKLRQLLTPPEPGGGGRPGGAKPGSGSGGWAR